jgi:hypothetical protein
MMLTVASVGVIMLFKPSPASTIAVLRKYVLILSDF